MQRLETEVVMNGLGEYYAQMAALHRARQQLLGATATGTATEAQRLLQQLSSASDGPSQSVKIGNNYY